LNPSNKKEKQNNSDVSQQRPVADGRGPLGLILHVMGCCAVCFVGLIMMLGSISGANSDNDEIAKAVRVPATITKVYMDDTIPCVDYKLTYQGTEYKPERWALRSPSSNTRADKEASLRPYKAGQVVSAYFLPDHPDRSFIDISYPNVFYDFYGMILACAVFLSVGAGWIPLNFLSIRSLITGVPISRNAHWVPPIVAFLVGFSIIEIDMIWYWTHTAPPYAAASYVWFAVPLFLGLLAVFKRDWLINLLILASTVIRPLQYFRTFKE
jgi:hypothetical protein